MLKYEYGLNNSRPPLPQKLLQLKDCYLATSGLVMDSEFNALDDCLMYCTSNDPRMYDRVRERTKVLKEQGQIIELDKEKEYFYFLNRYNIYPYGHLFDNLQMIHKLEKAGIDKSKLTTIKLKPTAHCTEVEKHLRYFGLHNTINVSFKNSLFGDRSKHLYRLYKVPTMWYSTIEAVPALWNPDLIEWFRNKYPVTDDLPKETKLYLTRGGGEECRRGVANNEEIVEFLKSQGFHVLYGNEPVEEMIKYFHNAELIIFPHGSMIKNSIFSVNNPYIIEFCPDNRPDKSFCHNSDTANLKHKQILLQGNKKYTITIPLELLKKELDIYENNAI
jgi:hypothetical protein